MDVFLRHLDDWEREVSAYSHIRPKERSRMFLSKETNEGLHITGELILSVMFLLIL